MLKKTKSIIKILLIVILIQIIIIVYLNIDSNIKKSIPTYQPSEVEVREFVSYFCSIPTIRKEESITENSYYSCNSHVQKLCDLYDTTPDHIISYDVPRVSTFKSWTNYHMLSRTSNQWKLQEQAYTDMYGLRKIGNAYLCAMATYYTNTVGDHFIITFEDDCQIEVIICDIKANIHTNETNQYTVNKGCMLEFYVDDNLYEPAARLGDVSIIPGLEGYITHVDKII